MTQTFYGSLMRINVFVCGYYFRSDQMHEECGSKIEGKSGQVVFDTDKLPANVTSCKLSLTAELCHDCPTIATRMLFYFTEFYMPVDCKNMYVSLLDGHDKFSPGIKGLPGTLCGRSISLLEDECVFTTTSNKMSIHFVRTDERIHHSATFTLVYYGFHTGACDRLSEVECSRRQIETVCSREVDVCASLNETICFSKSEVVVESSKTVKYITCGLLGIIALFALKFFYHQYRKGETEREGCVSRLKKRLARTLHENTNNRLSMVMNNAPAMKCYSCADSSTDSDEAVVNSAQANVDTIEANMDTAEANVDTNDGNMDAIEADVDTVEADADTIEFNVGATESGSEASLPISPSAPTLEEIESELPVLPPTYDESTVPSYNEVMAHQDKYVVN